MKIQVYLISLLLLSVSAHATVFKIATLSPDGTGWMRTMREGAAQIKQQTDGRVTFKFYPGGVMGSDDNVLRKIRIEQLQGGAVTTGSLSEIDPNIDIYGLPFLFSTLKQVDYVRKRMDPLLIKKLEGKGFVSFGLAEGGFAYMMSEYPVKSVEDLRDRKVWSPSGNKVADAVFAGADITPVSLPLSDVLTAMQTGLIDTVMASPIGTIALQWHTKIKYVVDVPLTYLTGLLVIDKNAFDKLSPNDAAVVRKVMSNAFQEIDAQNRKDNIAAREALKNQGIKFITLSPATLDAWHKIGDKAVKALEQQSDYDRGFYNKLIELVKSAPAAS